MFVSFFPRPLVFALSAILWGAFAVGIWYTFGPQLGTLLGFQFQASAEKLVGVSVFWSHQFLWFYLYFAISVALFASVWMILSPHPWSLWSIVGSALILFTSYFQVQVSVAIALKIGTRHAFSILLPTCNLRRDCVRRCECRRPDQVLCQPLHISLAHGDERLLCRKLAASANR